MFLILCQAQSRYNSPHATLQGIIPFQVRYRVLSFGQGTERAPSARWRTNHRKLGRLVQIVDFNELSATLRANPNTLRKRWRTLPHFFIGRGRTLKGARFDLLEVVEALKNDGMERPENRQIPVQIQAQGAAVRKKRDRDKEGRSGARGRGEKEVKRPRDPHGLLS